MKYNTLKLAILFLGAMILPLPTAFMGVDLVSNANAGNDTASLTVNASVPNNCNFNAGSVTLAFGNYDPVGLQATADLDQSTTFKFRCTKNGSATLGIDLGAHALSSQRRMVGGTSGDFLNYQLYSDAYNGTVWGNASGSWVPYTAATSGFATFTIYGVVPQAQDVSVDSYTDTATITASF